MPRPLPLTLFDLDHTLLDGDSDVLWCDFLMQRGALERTVFEPGNLRMAREYQAGSVYWNCCDRVSPRLPWSGVGHSGVGVTLSTYGIQAFTRPKAWHLRTV